jgi:uncharacterized protein (DUF362 family)
VSTGVSSVVAIVQSDLVITDNGGIDLDILHQMLEAGFEALSESDDATSYLHSAFGSASTVGMKVNTLGGPGASTHVELTTALTNLLTEAGIPKKKHLIWDRFDGELADIGYTINSRGDGPYCFGTDHQGVGYANDLVSKGQVGGLLSRILVDYCDALINMPVLKDHGVAGITGALKNHYGSIHNPNKYHGNGCNPYIADLNSLEQIRSRQRLIVMDALRVQFQGGPGYQRRWSAKYGALILGNDPVAIDTAGYGIIDGLRKKAGLESVKGSKREPTYIETAARYGLGNNNLEQIRIKELRV